MSTQLRQVPAIHVGGKDYPMPPPTPSKAKFEPSTAHASGSGPSIHAAPQILQSNGDVPPPPPPKYTETDAAYPPVPPPPEHRPQTVVASNAPVPPPSQSQPMVASHITATPATMSPVDRPAPLAITSPSSSSAPAGATSISLASPTSSIASSSRPAAVTKASVSLSGKKSISGTYYLDPCLRNPLFVAPHALRTTTEGVLTGLSAYPDERFNWTTGAPISGIAKLAKSYILPPDATFESDKGGLTLHIGVVDESAGRQGSGSSAGVGSEAGRWSGSVSRAGSGSSQPEHDGVSEAGDGAHKEKKEKKKRTRARVSVTSERGGVEIDLIQIDHNRQLDLDITTAAADILVLLPPDFYGTVSVAAPEPPNWGGALKPALGRVINTGESAWRTTVVPPALRKQSPARAGPSRGLSGLLKRHGDKSDKPHGGATHQAKGQKDEDSLHKAKKKFQEYLPAAIGKLTETIDGALDSALGGEYVNVEMVASGATALARAEQSKISIRTDKGIVLLGYRETRDRERVHELGMRVGEGSKPKSWWKSTF